MKSSDFFSLPPSLARFAPFFPPHVPPWEWVQRIGEALASVTGPVYAGNFPPGLSITGSVWIDPTAALPANGTIVGPVWIGPGAKLLPNCYLRGNVIIGADSAIGHGAEVKNALILDNVQAPHHPYIGDSIVGNGAHLAAGVVLSNLRLDRKNVPVRVPGGSPVDTGMRKFGAAVGDGAEIGCNAVLNPGTLLGPRSVVGPGIVFGGVLEADAMAFVRQNVTTTGRHE